ncbi:TBC1 domain family member 5 homolog A-like [Onthophagus taurus]|uniref:TBC1 domain family member 5 homolog A-like n=1 Tax=Onthophagus taurus TaxID=166361 RepID=UPI000C20C0CD|nr:myb-like protein D [Onthophagus taurus]
MSTNSQLEAELTDLKQNFYIAVGVLSTVLFLVGVLCAVLYYWLYILEQNIKKERNEEPNFKIRRAVIRDDPRTPSTSVHNDSNYYSSRPNDDRNNYKNPLTNNNNGQNRQSESPMDFREQLQQQLSQNNPNHRYGNVGNVNDWNNSNRNPRQSEQQLHQNFYGAGVDNGNFRY